MIAIASSLVLMRAVTTPDKSSGKSKKTTESGSVEVKFTSPPAEILHFNRYAIDEVGDFLQVMLWFEGMNVALTPVFRGLIFKDDFNANKSQVKTYMEKIGDLYPDGTPFVRPQIWDKPPVSFNFIDFVDRVRCSEVIIRSFSHKYVKDVAMSKSVVEGTTYGVYVSNGEIHRNFVYELLQKSSNRK